MPDAVFGDLSEGFFRHESFGIDFAELLEDFSHPNELLFLLALDLRGVDGEELLHLQLLLALLGELLHQVLHPPVRGAKGSESVCFFYVLLVQKVHARVIQPNSVTVVILVLTIRHSFPVIPRRPLALR